MYKRKYIGKRSVLRSSCISKQIRRDMRISRKELSPEFHKNGVLKSTWHSGQLCVLKHSMKGSNKIIHQHFQNHFYAGDLWFPAILTKPYKTLPLCQRSDDVLWNASEFLFVPLGSDKTHDCKSEAHLMKTHLKKKHIWKLNNITPKKPLSPKDENLWNSLFLFVTSQL